MREANAEIEELGHISRVWESKDPHGPLDEDRFHFLLADGLSGRGKIEWVLTFAATKS